jgi:hypothetical protein
MLIMVAFVILCLFLIPKIALQVERSMLVDLASPARLFLLGEEPVSRQFLTDYFEEVFGVLNVDMVWWFGLLYALMGLFVTINGLRHFNEFFVVSNYSKNGDNGR